VNTLAAGLPQFPWDTLADATARARAHPDGIVDLSIGTPVDPTPRLAQDALRASADAAGYPSTWGTPALRSAILGYLERRWGAAGIGERNVLPVIGSKEFVAWLPTMLGLGAGDVVVIPELAYPTYDVGVRVAGASVVATDDPERLAELKPRLVWINSPANPHGAILSVAKLRAWVEAARDCGAVLAADECYGEFAWDTEPVSVLHPSVCGGAPDGLLAVFSESKRSNAAGYRAGFVAGDGDIVAGLLEVCKHAGLMVPTPVQAAMTVLLGDQAHVDAQRERYARRRATLRPALEAAGFRVEHSEGSLYLWCTRGESGRDTVRFLAELGVLVAPGEFYGATGEQYVRVALTATDERVDAAAARLAATRSPRM